MNNEETMAQAAFLETKEYRRFAEFCDACRTSRYIGLCHGRPGVGKSFSAWHYARWNLIEEHFPGRFYDTPRLAYIEGTIASTVVANAGRISPQLRECRSALYTPSVTNTPKRVGQEIHAVRLALSHLVKATQSPSSDELFLYRAPTDPTDLLIVDETDRLKTLSLEQIRDMYDRQPIGVVLIGMPGLEKRLSRYGQLYSRVGFVHEFRALSSEEVQVFLQHQWTEWRNRLQSEQVADVDAIAAILRITSGNFRLLHRLLAQIERIVQINALRTISKEVVEIARQQLVIGSN